MTKYTSADILKCLDAQNIDCGFPAFSNFKINIVTARLRGFRSQTTWVILFEQLVNCYAAEGIQPILIIDAIGNCFSNKQNWIQESFFPVEIQNQTEWELKNEEIINQNLLFLTIRGKLVTVEYNSIKKHSNWNLGFNLLIYLLPTYRDKMLATDNEIQAILPSALEQIILLDNWYHPDILQWNQKANRHFRPSDAMSMQMIAQVLATGNIDLYQPCETPNIDWQIWKKD
ncbi:MAG: hypothetical protein KME29_19075 [Calothrix sp. FI2-JRJ7]|jgi:hypothetical protein|nr:hypothetical protein [Calothrix sp. FI2-JRJ7]